jgi:mono/diheme cytochrome c family protein
MKVSVRRVLKVIFIGLAWIVGIFAVIQLIPYGRTHSNPRVIREPDWDTPRTRELAKRACFDCHSNETRWPWYANVAPFSWVVQNDIENAREVLNFSAWQVTFPLATASGLSVRTGNMPPVKYRMAHREADLTPEETQALARGLDATVGTPSHPTQPSGS